jgi:bifunctional oligoribonuclease and PAP phosphatase NrnA
LKPAHISKVKALLARPKKITILTHWSPDGDAMGSSLGLYNYLIQKKHSVTVVTPNDYPDFLSWLPGNKKVVDALANPKKAAAAIKKAEVIFTLDFNSLKRIEALGEQVRQTDAVKILIDHHAQPEDYADYSHHTINTSSTCELIYEFICMLGDKKKINKAVAECLYTGIMTDTGSFRYPSTSANTHRVIADLVEAGARNGEIHQLIYDGNTESRMRLVGYCMQKMKVYNEYNAACISLSAEELTRFHYVKGDTEGVVNYALSIRNIKLSAFLVERDGKVKISLRSKGDFDVNLFARKHFNGGGHANAAGGSSDLSLEETERLFESLLPAYSKQLKK